MTNNQKMLIIVLLAVSLLVSISSVFWCFIKNTLDKKKLKKRNKAGISAALAFSGALIIAIWCLRFAVGYFAIVTSKPEKPVLSVGEEVVNSILGALRTFSMEEEYETYILNIEGLISAIVPSEARCFSLLQTCAVVYASMLNLIAPIVGGAIILEILASIFPKIKLKILHLAFWRKKYYFSELNATSLALAKSIYKRSVDAGTKMGNPVLIFTDTYIDDEKEKEYELLLEAKQFGAICVRDDLAHVIKPLVGKREYYLMDENEFGNLQTLMSLTEDNNIRYLKKSNIYLFVQSDAYVHIEKQINKKFEEYSEHKDCVDQEENRKSQESNESKDSFRSKENRKSKKKKILFKEGERPTIIPVLSYRNLVHNLFVDVPLYEPLIHKKNKKELNVTILGNGIIGTEAFLSAYWFGQILISNEENGEKSIDECQLTINVVSKDESDEFWSKIDYINTEIKDTAKVLDSNASENGYELLKYDSAGNANNPYCNVRYIKADVKMGGFWDRASEKEYGLLDSDYFIVALGNDADNISIADKLRRAIGQNRIERIGKADNTVIAYAVFNSEIAAKLNGDKYHQTRSGGKSDIYMYAFGSLDSVYSCDNIYMSRYKLLAETIGAAYNQSHIQKRLKADNDERKNSSNDNYSYWANLARAMHIKYKAFSLGLMDKSVFDYPSDKFDAYKSYVVEQCVKYIRIASAESPKEFDDEMLKIYNDAQLKKHRLAWLEHRRWNAFTRTMGYRHTSAEKLFGIKNRQKDMELKLHSCLVEARLPHLVESDTYMFSDFTEKSLEELDYLDLVSYERKKYNPSETVDYKECDYYDHDVYGYSDAGEIEQLIKFMEISQ